MDWRIAELIDKPYRQLRLAAWGDLSLLDSGDHDSTGKGRKLRARLSSPQRLGKYSNTLQPVTPPCNLELASFKNMRHTS